MRRIVAAATTKQARSRPLAVGLRIAKVKKAMERMSSKMHVPQSKYQQHACCCPEPKLVLLFDEARRKEASEISQQTGSK